MGTKTITFRSFDSHEDCLEKLGDWMEKKGLTGVRIDEEGKTPLYYWMECSYEE